LNAPSSRKGLIGLWRLKYPTALYGKSLTALRLGLSKKLGKKKFHLVVNYRMTGLADVEFTATSCIFWYNRKSKKPAII
jgi:hypothetical protein